MSKCVRALARTHTCAHQHIRLPAQINRAPCIAPVHIHTKVEAGIIVLALCSWEETGHGTNEFQNVCHG